MSYTYRNRFPLPNVRFVTLLVQPVTEMFKVEHDGFVFLVTDVSVIRLDRRQVAR